MSLPAGDVWEEVYASMHDAYDAMRAMMKAKDITAEQIADKLGDNLDEVRSILRARQSLSFETLSRYATAMDCRLKVEFVRYEDVQ